MTQANATLALPQSASRDWRTPLELCVLGAIWGASFMLMRVAAPEFGAVPLVEIRLAAGALILLPFLYAHRALFPARRWAILALIGAINSAIPFSLFAWAATIAPAGIGAIWYNSVFGSGHTLHMQTDGHLVVYNGANQPVWYTGTSGNNGAILKVQDDGNVVIYNHLGQPIWATNTSGA